MPLDPFFDFSFPSYGRFREGDPLTQQKVLPHLTVGHCLQAMTSTRYSTLLYSGFFFTTRTLLGNFTTRPSSE